MTIHILRQQGGGWVRSEKLYFLLIFSTGKPLPEALILASINPQYDDRLFIELQVQYMKIPSSNLMLCTEIVSDIQNPSITDGVHRNKNFVEIISVFSTFPKCFKVFQKKL